MTASLKLLRELNSVGRPLRESTSIAVLPIAFASFDLDGNLLRESGLRKEMFANDEFNEHLETLSLNSFQNIFSSEDFKSFSQAVKDCVESSLPKSMLFECRLGHRGISHIHCVVAKDLREEGPFLRLAFKDYTLQVAEQKLKSLELSLWEMLCSGTSAVNIVKITAAGVQEIFNASEVFVLRNDRWKGEVFWTHRNQGWEKTGFPSKNCVFASIIKETDATTSLSCVSCCGLSDIGWLKVSDGHGATFMLLASGLSGRQAQIFKTHVPLLQRSLENALKTKAGQDRKEKSYEKSAALVKAAGMALWEYDVDNDELSFEHSGLKFFGCSWEGTEKERDWQKWIEQNVHPEDNKQAAKAFLSVIKGEAEVFEVRVRIKSADGRYFPFLSKSAFIEKDEEGRVKRIHGINIELTKAEEAREALKEKEMLLIQNQKLAIIGELCANVAHEVKNPLAVISIESELLGRDQSPLSEKMSQSLARMNKGIQRINQIADGLRRYSRAQRSEAKLCDLNELALECVDFLRNFLAKDNVFIDFDTREKSLFSVCEPDKVQQVLFNLISNAKHSVLQNTGERRIQIVSSRELGTIVIRVKDNGQGIPQEIKDNIFKEFFTTKNEEQGTGIGLPLSQKIMREQGGELLLEESCGKGAVFAIYLQEST